MYEVTELLKYGHVLGMILRGRQKPMSPTPMWYILPTLA